MKCALIGERLGHSYSKLIHEAFGLYSYELVSLPKDKVGEFMENEEFDAFNVTIPYKRTVMPYCSYISPEAKKIGSVNVISSENIEKADFLTQIKKVFGRLLK